MAKRTKQATELTEGAPWVSNEVSPVEDDGTLPPPPTIQYIQIRYRWPNRYIVRGPSGARYEFSDTHRESAVLASDVPFLMGKVKHSGGCCGAPKQIDQVFELV